MCKNMYSAKISTFMVTDQVSHLGIIHLSIMKIDTTPTNNYTPVTPVGNN